MSIVTLNNRDNNSERRAFLTEDYIVDTVRTATGKRRGFLQNIHGVDLAAHAIEEIVERNNIPQDEYDDVVFGCFGNCRPLGM